MSLVFLSIWIVLWILIQIIRQPPTIKGIETKRTQHKTVTFVDDLLIMCDPGVELSAVIGIYEQFGLGVLFYLKKSTWINQKP